MKQPKFNEDEWETINHSLALRINNLVNLVEAHPHLEDSYRQIIIDCRSIMHRIAITLGTP